MTGSLTIIPDGSARSQPLADPLETCGDVSLSNEEPRPQTRAIVKELLWIALPNMLSYVMELVNELTNTVIIGHSGTPAALAAVGLGNMMQNCIGLSVGFGICGALDTLVSQAFGAGRHAATVSYLQRCRIIVALQLIWMFPLLWFSHDLLLLIHQDPDVARDAGEYNRASVWGLFAVFQFEAGMKFLQNRQLTLPVLIISVGTSILHVGWCSLFVMHWGMGNAGAGYANCVTWWSRLVLISIYFACSARRFGLTKRSLMFLEASAFREWSEYGQFAIPATIQLVSEWWFWELCALVVGYLGKTALAAHVSALNFMAVCFMPVIGLQSATSTLTGNALGANQPRKTRKTVIICFLSNLVMWSIFAICILLGRHLIAEAYTEDEDIRKVIANLFAIFAFAGFGDSSQNIMGGALRGIGLQKFASVVYIVIYYFVMFPSGLLLAFPLKLGIYGIWYSFVIGTVLAAFLFAFKLRKLNYKKLAEEAAERMEAEEAASKTAEEAVATSSA